MKSHAGAVALGKALQDYVRAHKTSARAVSVALGFHPLFLTRCFNGHRPLRVELVFQVLEHLNAVPYELFRALYPFGGNKAGLYRGPGKSAFDLPGLMTLEEAIREQFRRLGTRSPAEYRLRLGEWLQREMRRRGATARSISIGLGLGKTSLGQALRGESQLNFSHVFGALEALGADPGRMFLALFLPDLDSPAANLERENLLAYLDTVVQKTDEGFLLRRERLKKAAPKPPAEPEPEEAPNGEPGNGPPAE